MNHRLVLIVIWSVATIASISVVFAGVAGVRSAIAAPGSFRLPAEASSPPPDDPILTTTPPTESMSTTSTVETASTEASPTTSTTEAAPTSAAPPPATTTEESASGEETTQPTQPDLESYEVEGGWVSVEVDANGVYLESASPRPGWTVKVENQGPEEVVVVFKGEEQETQFVAKFDDGRLKIKIED